MDQVTTRAAVAEALGARVVVRDVFRIYREGDIETVALRGVDLDLAAGEYVAIMGRSGSGKSTLLNLISGADRPSAGSIQIDGVEVGQASESTRAAMRGRTVGHVVQSGNLVEFLDLVENVQLATALSGPRVDVDAALTILRRVGLADHGRRRPGALSGGEQQRAALALVLACRPRLLLADEVTGELDHASAGVVLDALDHIRAETGATTLLVTHDPDVAARAERIIEIRDGRTIELGKTPSTSPVAHG